MHCCGVGERVEKEIGQNSGQDAVESGAVRPSHLPPDDVTIEDNWPSRFKYKVAYGFWNA